MAAELVVKLDESFELASDGRDPLLELPRALLHRQAANTERDDLEVREERVRRSGDDFALRTVRA